ncbi:ABC transporter ATP-binding protein [candidate division KSB1 bacterium]|nr:ABC transporter ATP-binding protein [candidate division KSB1 bacterium]
MDSLQNKKLILFDSVSKNYQDLFALKDVSFEIKAGEIFGYIGPNGAGKTTTIKIIVGLVREFSGNCTIAGYSMPDHFNNVQKLVGYLPQDVAFQEWRTVDHALKTFGRLSGMNENELEQRIKEVLDLLELADVRNKKIQKLSGGMIQKVGIAQAFLHQPKLLILDEPLSGLDPASRHQIKQTLREMSNNGTTIFFSSHILSDVEDIASRIGILNKGRLLKIGTMDELKSEFFQIHEIEILFSGLTEGWKNLTSLSGIKKIEQRTPGKLIVAIEKTADMDEISHHILKQLIELDCRIKSFKPIIPNLDDVYLKYISEDKQV